MKTRKVGWKLSIILFLHKDYFSLNVHRLETPPASRIRHMRPQRSPSSPVEPLNQTGNASTEWSGEALGVPLQNSYLAPLHHQRVKLRDSRATSGSHASFNFS
ncbi:MAG: hypothetical protein QW566_06790 [Candidatus Jordarchaeales archaeon]